jgi:hypothetical protein
MKPMAYRLHLFLYTKGYYTNAEYSMINPLSDHCDQATPQLGYKDINQHIQPLGILNSDATFSNHRSCCLICGTI